MNRVFTQSDEPAERKHYKRTWPQVWGEALRLYFFLPLLTDPARRPQN